MITDIKLKQTPLHADHLALHAKMVPFGGWDMPLQYEGILAEYQHTRQHVSVFDTSHMGEFLIEGEAKACGLDKIVTQSLIDLPVKTSRYGFMLNDSAGVIDDLIVFRLEEKKWLIVVNAGTMENDAHHMLTNLAEGSFKNISKRTGKLDVQGPLARDVLASFVQGIEELKYFHFDTFDVLGEKVIVSRTGYTGELGYEIFYPGEKMPQLWQALLDKGARPAGLGVRDVLRLEMGYSLYGHELTEAVSPLEAGLEKFVNWNKEFIGRDALGKEKTAGPHRRMIAFIAQSRRSPRAHHKIYLREGPEIGEVTSGSFSPALNAGIGLGLVEQGKLDLEATTIDFGGDTNRLTAQITRLPFYKKGSLKE